MRDLISNTPIPGLLIDGVGFVFVPEKRFLRRTTYWVPPEVRQRLYWVSGRVNVYLLARSEEEKREIRKQDEILWYLDIIVPKSVQDLFNWQMILNAQCVSNIPRELWGIGMRGVFEYGNAEAALSRIESITGRISPWDKAVLGML